jgi:adenylosuccinate synthase
MSVVVIGLQFGDEGKGRVVSELARENPRYVVSRYSGGGQAGHRVIDGDFDHIFSNFASGTSKGCLSVWQKSCTFDPKSFLVEYEILKKKGVQPKIMISNDCPVITDFDVEWNRQLNAITEHGTVGSGVGATFEREENHFSLKVRDCFYRPILHERLKHINDYYQNKYINCKWWGHDWSDVEEVEEELFNLFSELKNLKEFVNFADLEKYDKHPMLFESSQGLLLDQKIGFFPHVTRASVGTSALPYEVHSAYFVTRAYQTRHGNGFMTNENIPHNIKNNDEKNVFNKFQGEFRTAILDLDLLIYALNSDDWVKQGKPFTLVVTCVDHIRDDLRLTHEGVQKSFLNEIEFLQYIEKHVCTNRNMLLYTDSGDCNVDMKEI